MKLLILFLIIIASCNVVKVRTEHGWMGSSTYHAYKDGISVDYYDGNCCCVAEKVIKQIAKDANNGLIDWSKMSDKKFQDETLQKYCDKFKEDNYHGTNRRN